MTLRQMREASGLSMAQFAIAVGLTPDALWHQLNGKRGIGVRIASRIAAATGTTAIIENGQVLFQGTPRFASNGPRVHRQPAGRATA